MNYFKNVLNAVIGKKSMIRWGNALNMNQSFNLLDTSQDHTIIHKGYNANDQFYSVVKLVLSNLKKMDLDMFEVKTPKAKRLMKAGAPMYSIKAEDLEPVEQHDFLKLWDRPNDDQSKFDFIEALGGYYLILGKSFWHIASPENGMDAGKPIKWDVIPPPFIQQIIVDDWGNAEKYKLTFGTGHQQDIDADEIIDLLMFNPDPLSRSGLSPVKPGARVLTRSQAETTAAAKIMQNLGPPGILFDEADASEYAELSTTQREEFERRFRERTGATNANEIFIASRKMGYLKIGQSVKELQIPQMEISTLRRWCNLYQVPSVLLNDTASSTYSNVKEAKEALIRNAVLPVAQTIVTNAQMKALPYYEKRDGKTYALRLNLDVWPELEADKVQQAAWLNTSWWMTGNQRLQVQGLPLSDDPMADQFMVPSNLIPMGGIGTGEGLKGLLKHYSQT